MLVGLLGYWVIHFKLQNMALDSKINLDKVEVKYTGLPNRERDSYNENF